MDGLAAALAHELNQPLAAILSNAQAAKRFLRDGTPDDLPEILQDIIDDDKRASEIIDRLRRMLRKETTKQESLDINQLVRGLARLTRSDRLARDMTLDLELTPDLPWATGDGVQLQQVILNLLTNACDAMMAQPPEHRRIVLSTQRNNAGGVHLAVRDYGPGIDATDQERIFTPFFSTKKEGMGMGPRDQPFPRAGPRRSIVGRE